MNHLVQTTNIQFHNTMAKFHTLAAAITTKFPKSPITTDITDHISFYTSRWKEGTYHPDNSTTLEKQPFTTIDDRYSIQSIKGIYNEFLVRYALELQQFNTQQASSYDDQTQKQIDIIATHPDWKHPITLQCKTTPDTINIDLALNVWLNTSATRLAIVSPEWIFWADTIAIKKAILDFTEVDQYGIQSIDISCLYAFITKYPSQKQFTFLSSINNILPSNIDFINPPM